MTVSYNSILLKDKEMDLFVRMFQISGHRSGND